MSLGDFLLIRDYMSERVNVPHLFRINTRTMIFI